MGYSVLRLSERLGWLDCPLTQALPRLRHVHEDTQTLTALLCWRGFTCWGQCWFKSKTERNAWQSVQCVIVRNNAAAVGSTELNKHQDRLNRVFTGALTSTQTMCINKHLFYSLKFHYVEGQSLTWYLNQRCVSMCLCSRFIRDQHPHWNLSVLCGIPAGSEFSSRTDENKAEEHLCCQCREKDPCVSQSQLT